MMQIRQTNDLGVGLESRGLGTTGVVFRNGLPFRGSGRPIRDAEVWTSPHARMMAGVAVAVDWLPDVSWEVVIRRARL